MVSWTCGIVAVKLLILYSTLKIYRQTGCRMYVCSHGSKWRHADIYAGHVHHARSFQSLRNESRRPDTLHSWFDLTFFFVFFHLRKISLHFCLLSQTFVYLFNNCYFCLIDINVDTMVAVESYWVTFVNESTIYNENYLLSDTLFLSNCGARFIK